MRKNKERAYDSLYSLLNRCMTPFGSRFLHYTMANPLTNINEIRLRHEKVGILIQDERFRHIRSCIRGSVDGERIVRRLEVAWKLTPTLVE